MTAPRTLTCDEVRDLAPLFVLDALGPDDMDAVRGHLAGCADAHLELLELGEAGTALLETAEPAEPPARLRSRLLAAAAADLAEGRHPSTASAGAPVAPAPVTSAPATTPSPSNVVDIATARSRRGSRLGWLVAVAAVVAVVVIGASNLALRRDLDAAQAYQAGVSQALDLAAQPGSTTALLAGEDGSVSGFAVVGADGTVRLTVQGLAATTGSQVYTAWAIVGEAAPVPLGDFTVGADGVATATGTSPTTTPGATLALTLEPNGGNTSPTGPIVAAGVTRDPAG
ncbi:MAG TPA: anti-sigma factor [Candidatus Limnocylindrales bacterium]|nr:anti-sigma factor [Candidatus Limnocylindrales bacterium]